MVESRLAPRYHEILRSIGARDVAMLCGFRERGDRVADAQQPQRLS